MKKYLTLVHLDYFNACFVLFIILLSQIVPPWKFASPFGFLEVAKCKYYFIHAIFT